MESTIEKSDLLKSIIRARRTDKITCEVEDRQPVPSEIQKYCDQQVLDSLMTAGWAPFFPASNEKIPEPWRAHILWDEDVLELTNYLVGPEVALRNKLPKLTAACNALVLINWIPIPINQIDDIKTREKTTKMNEEHLASTAAMIQNFLLMLTAHNMGNYWSSGGDLGGAKVFEFLKIPKTEKLIAAVFIEYNEMQSDKKTRVAGQYRDKRSEGWINEVKVRD